VLQEILPTIEKFQINAGHSGTWFNPATSGQGQISYTIDGESLAGEFS